MVMTSSVDLNLGHSHIKKYQGLPSFKNVAQPKRDIMQA